LPLSWVVLYMSECSATFKFAPHPEFSVSCVFPTMKSTMLLPGLSSAFFQALRFGVVQIPPCTALLFH
jgi:hypothetical protein